jgi:hypothetical protein
VLIPTFPELTIMADVLSTATFIVVGKKTDWAAMPFETCTFPLTLSAEPVPFVRIPTDPFVPKIEATLSRGVLELAVAKTLGAERAFDA